MTEQEFVDSVYGLFGEFRDGHRAFWNACRINEMFYMGDHWNAARALGMSGPGNADVQPVTPVLFSTLDNLESDLRSGQPEPLYLPQRLDGRRTARELTQVVEQTLEDSGFETAYERWVHDALVCGTGVLQIVYDDEAQGGIGAAEPRYVDVCNFMADPMYEDIQQGRACFKFTRVRGDWIEQHYPEKKAHVEMDAESLLGVRDGNSPVPQSDAPDEAVLIECWQREYDARARKWRVHMALVAGGALLEDSRADFPGGYYDHGEYPFAVLSLFPIKGTYLGFSLIEVFSTMQIYSDKLDQIVLINAALGGNPRLLVSTRSNIDLTALSDPRRKVITGDRIDEGAVRQMDVPPIPHAIAQLAQRYRESLKEESGQNQFGRGEAGKGVTAASAIQALQEASGKRSMKLERHVHAVFRQSVAKQLVELIRQFYTGERIFTVVDAEPESGAREEYEVSPARGKLKRTRADGRVEEAEIPEHVLVKTRVQRARVYDAQYYNDFALQLVKTGAASLEDVLDIMHFDGKEALRAALERGQRS